MIALTTFSVRMLCNNCGHEASYDIPQRSIILSYIDQDDNRYDGDVRYSHYYPFKHEDKAVMIECSTCRLAMLGIIIGASESIEAVK